MPRACPEQRVAQLACTESVFYTGKTARHTILFPAPPSPCCRNITGEQPVGVADSEVSSCCDMLANTLSLLRVVMARHRRWSWSLIAPSRVAMAFLFHRGIRYVCRPDQLDAGTPPKALTGPDGTRGPAPVTAHNGHGGTRAGWYAALVGGLLSASS